MGKLKRLVAGQPLSNNLSASTWNEMVDHTERNRNRGRLGIDRHMTSTPLAQTVRCMNVSGSPIAVGDALGIDSVFPDPSANLDGFLQTIVLHVGTTLYSSHYERFVVALEPAADSAIFNAAIGGIVRAEVNVNNALNDRVTIQDSSTQLESSWHGSGRILWKEAGTGLRWALVQLGWPDERELDALPTTNITDMGTGTAEVYFGGVGTGDTLTVHLDWITGGEDISSGKPIRIRWYADMEEWRVISAECE